MTTDSTFDAIDSYVDWAVADRTATRLIAKGPAVAPATARQTVAHLAELAPVGLQLATDVTGLDVTDQAAVDVVDSASWARYNLKAFRQMLAPAARTIAERGVFRDGRPMAARAAGLELGGVLAFLGGRVLGQYDPFVLDGPGRLLLVAPNIVKIERRLGVDPADFRLWVCVHEQTHRLQFAAAPWLAAHLLDLMTQILVGLTSDSDGTEQSPTQVFARIPDLLRRRAASPADRRPRSHVGELMDQVTAIMSLLEGHADVVMDEVGPEVICTVADIRQTFSEYRRGGNPLAQLLRRLTGVDSKLKQYEDGAEFVRSVLRHTSMAEFNRVWHSPDNLPTLTEIHAPVAWLARLGAAAATPARKV